MKKTSTWTPEREDQMSSFTRDLVPSESKSHGETVAEIRANTPMPGGPFITATYVGVLLFCTLFFFRPEDFFPSLANIPFAKVAGIITAGALAASILSGKVKFLSEIKLILALFLYLCICVPGSLWPGGSFDLIVNGFSKITLIAIGVMCAVTSLKRLRRIVLVQILAMLTMSVLALSHNSHGGRMFGVGKMFGDPNDFALQLCVILPFCVALLLSSRRWPSKLFWLCSTGTVLVTIISTYSRGGFLALVAVFLAMWRRFSARSYTGVFLALVIALFLGVALSVVGTPSSSYFDRLSTIANPQADATGSAEARRQLLIDSVKVTLKHPLFGVGPGQFMQFSGSWHQTHNSYTQLSSEAGIPALLLFATLMNLAFRRLHAVRAERVRGEEWYFAGATYCALVGYLVGAFFLSTAYWLLPYSLVAYASVLERIHGPYCDPQLPSTDVSAYDPDPNLFFGDGTV